MAHSFKIERHAAWVDVWQSGRLETLEQARAMQAEVEQAMASAGCRRAVFDNRETDAHDDAVRDAMFAWSASERFERAAIIVNGELTKIRANMQALGIGSAVRAFNDPSLAREWVAAVTPRRS